MIKGLVHQEHMTVLNIYACNTASQQMKKKKRLQGKMKKTTIIVRDFNTYISIIGKNKWTKISVRKLKF